MLQKIITSTTNKTPEQNSYRTHLEKRVALSDRAIDLAYATGDRDLGVRFCQHLIRYSAALERHRQGLAIR